MLSSNKTVFESNSNQVCALQNQLACYCSCQETQTNDTLAHDSEKDVKSEQQIQSNDDKVFASKNFQTYKQLKRVANKANPGITKELIYEKLLKPFKHEIVKIWSQAHTKFKSTYICKYDNCCKEFEKVWNMLDHVRMHEGIKPYV